MKIDVESLKYQDDEENNPLAIKYIFELECIVEGLHTKMCNENNEIYFETYYCYHIEHFNIVRGFLNAHTTNWSTPIDDALTVYGEYNW